MTMGQATFAYVGAFVDELARAGVEHVVISPGSRSTPLALLLREHEGINTWVQVDERSAAYFALGMAKAEQKPVAMLCSSGTAAANYYPAIIEAEHAHVPLIVLTSDRPHELRDVGAPQAMDQLALYGNHVKWFVEMAVPEDTPQMLRYARTMAVRAAATASAYPRGPVHLNFPFREPLIPELPTPLKWKGERTDTPHYAIVEQGKREPDPDYVRHLATELIQLERGLIVCGPQLERDHLELVTQLAQDLQYPLLADPLSQLRSDSFDQSLLIDSYDIFLREPKWVDTMQPEVIIRFGAMPVSKAFLLYIQQHPNCRQVVIDGQEGWKDPTLLATDMVYAQPARFCQQLQTAIRERRERAESEHESLFECQLRNRDGSSPGSPPGNSPGNQHSASLSPWCTTWVEVNRQTKHTVQHMYETTGLFEDKGMFEGRIFYELSQWLPSETSLFVGNSMPVRDLDTFYYNGPSDIHFLANRGVNGIDGVVSSALGVQAVQSRPLVLVIGDLSFYHDLNGLLAAKQYLLNVTIIIVNNDGGGIFSFLPQAEHGRHFEELFGTSIDLDYEHVVRMYEGDFRRVTSWSSFREAILHGIGTEGLHVIEVKTDRNDNVSLHRTVFRQVFEDIRPLINEVNDHGDGHQV